MADASKPDFKAANKHFDELSERQQEVLELMAEGRANAEIAKSLSMTLDEARWNITATVSKLGFERRHCRTVMRKL